METKPTRWDEDFMSLCLVMAKQAEGRTAPNPMVGSLVVSTDGIIVGRGYHRQAGEPHAEVLALDEAREAARDGTLYVNLEPCNHQGKTPPCAPRIIESGVKRVVVGMQDPNKKVDGSGLKLLREAGLEVIVDILRDECFYLNRGFVKRVTENLPWVVLKLATTLDGRIADRNGKSRWVTGTEARQYVHDLRNKIDCVLVGRGTVQADDPNLTVREVSRSRDPVRAVVDTNLSISPTSRICKLGSSGRSVIFCSEHAKSNAGTRFPDSVELVPTDASGNGGGLNLRSVLEFLAKKGMNTVLCEGGAALSASLLSAKLVDEVHWVVAPKILGDVEAKPGVASTDFVDLDQALELTSVKHTRLGDDLLIQGLILGK
jgi:diaminohydroxyphosphoribosylaminopyrimidine deaminase / 5-amino-6-(5-phosphoribosylamino)uracil reductase